MYMERVGAGLIASTSSGETVAVDELLVLMSEVRFPLISHTATARYCLLLLLTSLLLG